MTLFHVCGTPATEIKSLQCTNNKRWKADVCLQEEEDSVSMNYFISGWYTSQKQVFSINLQADSDKWKLHVGSFKNLDSELDQQCNWDLHCPKQHQTFTTFISYFLNSGIIWISHEYGCANGKFLSMSLFLFSNDHSNLVPFLTVPCTLDVICTRHQTSKDSAMSR